MYFKKFMAVFAVLIMALSATACIVSTSSDSQAAPLRDQGTVALDVDKDYFGNARELAKLGLQGDSWVKVDDGYKLVLNNVVYETDAPTALKVTSAEDKVLYVECNGENKFVSKGMDANGCNIGIDAGKKTVAICFIGDGELTVETDNTKAIESIAIYAYWLGVKECTLIASSSDLEMTTATNNEEYLSYAIFVMNHGGMEVLDDAKVYAVAGDIKSTDEGHIASFISTAISSRDDSEQITFKVKDSYIFAIGGDVSTPLSNFAISWGATIGGKIEIDSSLLFCDAGDVTAGSVASGASEGMFIKNDFTVHDSVIDASAGDIQADAVIGGNAGLLSIGIQCNVAGTAMTIGNTDFFSHGGKANVDEIGKGKYCFSAGILFQIHDPFTVTLEHSVLGAEGEKGSDAVYGFVMMTPQFEISDNGTLSISDSEFYAAGTNSAMAVKNVSCVETPKWCGYMKDGKWIEPKGKDPALIPTDATAVSIGYKYYVYLESSYGEYIECVVVRIDGDTYKLPECPFDAPEGKKFKCWSVDGVEKYPGETINVQYYAVVTAVWDDVPGPVPPGPEPEPSQSDDNTMLVIGGVLVAMIAIFAFAVVWQSTKK